MQSKWCQIALNVNGYFLNNSKLLYVIIGHNCDIINLNVWVFFLLDNFRRKFDRLFSSRNVEFETGHLVRNITVLTVFIPSCF